MSDKEKTELLWEQVTATVNQKVLKPCRSEDKVLQLANLMSYSKTDFRHKIKTYKKSENNRRFCNVTTF